MRFFDWPFRWIEAVSKRFGEKAKREILLTSMFSGYMAACLAACAVFNYPDIIVFPITVAAGSSTALICCYGLAANRVYRSWRAKHDSFFGAVRSSWSDYRHPEIVNPPDSEQVAGTQNQGNSDESNKA